MNTTDVTIAVPSETVLREPSTSLLPSLRPEPKDVLQQLKTNLALLEDQCGRLHYMLKEVRSVIRK